MSTKTLPWPETAAPKSAAADPVGPGAFGPGLLRDQSLKSTELTGYARAMELMDQSWKDAISKMTGEEVAARFMALLFPYVFSEKEAAAILKVTRQTLKSWRDTGLINYTRRGKAVRYFKHDLLANNPKSRRA